jgi:hypothetical protein
MLKRLLPLLIAAVLLAGCSPAGTSSATNSAGDQLVANALQARQSGVQVTGAGTVDRNLTDDTDGGRHQRFVLRLASGQTLLVAHNIDIAPRIPTLRVGDTVEYGGVYEWNAQGGVIHWTHHDPSGQHQGGWLKRNGQVYQ